MHAADTPSDPPLVADIGPTLRLLLRLAHQLPENPPERRWGVDVTGWLAWALVGLHVFVPPSESTQGPGPGVPPIRVAVRTARAVMVALAMLRHRGNLSRAAKALGTSRRALREQLKAAGLYPWHRVMAALVDRELSQGVDDELTDDDELDDDHQADEDQLADHERDSDA